MIDNDPQAETSGQEFVLTEKNYLQYLLGIDENGNLIPDADIDKFPSNLTFPFGDELKQVYELEAKGSIMSPEWQDKFNSFAQVIEDLGQPQLAETNREKAQEQGLAEKARDFYFDFQEGKIKSTEISTGTNYSVRGKTMELYSEGKQPLLETHTHPSPSLPSSVDYLPTIKSLDDGQRVCRAIMVLNPDHQVLAIATKDTPIFIDWNEAREYVKTLASVKDPEFMKVEQKAAELRAAEIRRLSEEIQRIYSQNLQQMDENVINSLKAQITSLGNNSIGKINKIDQEARGEGNPLLNQNDIKNSRILGMALYWSTDCTNFKRWSA